MNLNRKTAALPAYDPAAVPEWACESTGRIAREQPESLPYWLEHVAEVEAPAANGRAPACPACRAAGPA